MIGMMGPQVPFGGVGINNFLASPNNLAGLNMLGGLLGGRQQNGLMGGLSMGALPSLFQMPGMGIAGAGGILPLLMQQRMQGNQNGNGSLGGLGLLGLFGGAL